MRSSAALPQLDIRLTWRAILGLDDPVAPGWTQVRAAQFHQLVRLGPIICIVHMFGATALAWLLRRAVPDWQLAAWSMLLVGMAVWHCMAALRRGRSEARTLTHMALIVWVTRSILIGLLWAVPPAWFAATASVTQLLAICLVCAAMMASTLLSAATIPLGMVGSIVAMAGGMTAMMRALDEPLLAAVPLLYGAALAAGGLFTGKSFIQRRWSEQVIAEKGAFVSLLLREFEDKGADWLWQVDAQRRLRSVSPRLAHAAQRTAAELEGQSLFGLLAGDGWERGEVSADIAALVERMNARETIGELMLAVLVDGETRWWSLSASPRYDEGGVFAGYRGVGSDVTEQRRSSDAIEQMARHDALTQLANRAHVMETLRDELGRIRREGGRAALLLIDLDKFKPVNDTLGHPVGDRVLKLVAERIRTLMGPGELVGRLGGDEFAVVVRHADDLDRVDRMGEAVIDALSQPFEIDGHLVRIGASVGAAAAPQDGRSVDTLLRHADLALYRAKADGRGVHRRYDRSMLAAAARKQAIDSGLREAIDDHQFHLLYQPVVDADTGRIESLEALIRWVHPTLGEVPPVEFMPVAEESRLSGAIGAWVLRTACAEAVRWPRQVALSVNLSAKQLADRELTGAITAALSASKLPPWRLMLEVSETIFMAGDTAVIHSLERLQALGVKIALDDFGTGYASLGYVKDKRFSAIKIDERFVRGAASDTNEGRAIVRAVVALADTLGVPTIAEGAETHSQLARMYELGVRRVQGHLAAAPMAAHAAAALVATQDDHAPTVERGIERDAVTI